MGTGFGLANHSTNNARSENHFIFYRSTFSSTTEQHKWFKRLSPEEWLTPRPESGLGWLVVFRFAKSLAENYYTNAHM